jgi:hypothetical protein
MKWRDIILLLGSLALLRPSTGAAQTSDRMRRIGWIEGLRTSPYNWADVAEHLQPLGWTRARLEQFGGSLRIRTGRGGACVVAIVPVRRVGRAPPWEGHLRMPWQARLSKANGRSLS